ncbi:hypothetical protein ABW21_db0207031 [Orbilia brochopaga]|nr:hypothetical protein ABW21_db0207031 [Drechslerella brochopaga]
MPRQENNRVAPGGGEEENAHLIGLLEGRDWAASDDGQATEVAKDESSDDKESVEGGREKIGARTEQTEKEEDRRRQQEE